MNEIENKEIEKMAGIMCGHKCTCQDCLRECTRFGFAFDCECLSFAEKVYKKGYRKQSETVKEFAEQLKKELFANCVIIKTVYNSQKEDMDSSEAFQMINELAEQYGKEE